MLELFLLVFLVGAVLFGLLRGGKLVRLAYLPFRHSYLIIAGLLLQVVIFSSWWSQHFGSRAVPQIYIFSMGIVLAALLLNFRLPGMVLVTIGLCLNLLAISANGGYMPASPDSLRTAGFEERLASPQGGTYNNSTLVNEETRLWFLTDIFALPASLPLANVFSIGDVMLALGVCRLIYVAMTRDLSLGPHGPPV